MSQFFTPIKIDLDQIKKQMPAETYVESVTWNAASSRLEIVWSNRNLRTKWSIPTEFPLANLQEKTVPPGIEIKPVNIVIPPATTATEPEPVKISPAAGSVNDNEKPVAKRRKGSIKPLSEQ